MNITKILITFGISILCGTIHMKENLEDTKVLPGLILHRTGSVSFIEGYLDIIVSLKCPAEIKHLVVKLSHSVAEIMEDLLPTLALKFKNVTKTYQAYHWDLELLRARVRITYTRLVELSNTPWMSVRTGKTKEKRAAFDLVGDILKTLFGTATTKQIRSLQKKISLLSDQTATSKLIVKQLRDQLRSNTESLRNLRETVLGLIKNQDSISTVVISMGHLNSVKTYLDVVDNAINNIMSLYKLVINTMQLAKEKHTNDLIFNINVLLPFISEMTQTTLLHPVMPLTTENFHNFITYTWTVESSVETFEVVTLIPFISVNIFSAYRIFPFPTHISTNYSSARIIYQDPNKYVYIDYVNRKYTYLRDSIHGSCRHIGDKAICPLTQPLSSIDEITCFLSLLTNQSMSFTHCPMYQYEYKEPFSANLGRYSLLSLAQKSTASIACKNPDSVQHITDFIFVIPHGCTFSTSKYHFRNPLHLGKNISLMSLISSSDKVLFSFVHHLAIPDITSSLYSKTNIPKEVSWNTRLDRLNESLLFHIPNTNYVKYVPHIGGMVMTMFSFLFVLILVGIFWKTRRFLFIRCLQHSTREEIPLREISTPAPQPELLDRTSTELTRDANQASTSAPLLPLPAPRKPLMITLKAPQPLPIPLQLIPPTSRDEIYSNVSK